MVSETNQLVGQGSATETIVHVFAQHSIDDVNLEPVQAILLPISISSNDTTASLYAKVARRWNISENIVRLWKLRVPWPITDPAGLTERLCNHWLRGTFWELCDRLGLRDNVMSHVHDPQASVFLAVRSNIYRSPYSDFCVPEWAREWHTRVRKNGEDPFQTTDTGELVIDPSFTDLLWSSGETMLVRPEYETLWEHMTTSKKNLVAVGPPGSGKTVFLYYALLKALQSMSSVVFSAEPGVALRFAREGPRFMTKVDIPWPPSDELGLFDSQDCQPNDGSPAAAALQIIVTAPPQYKLFSHFHKRRNAMCWVMDPWSEEEMASLTRIAQTPEGFYTPLELFPYVGPLPKSCRMKVRNTGDPEEDVKRALGDCQIPNESIKNLIMYLYHYLTNIPAPFNAKDVYQTFCPVPTRQKLCFHHSKGCQFVIPTFFLRQRFLEVLYAASPEKLGPIFRLFRVFLSAISDPLLDTMVIVGAARHGLRYMSAGGSQEHEIPVLPLRCPPSASIDVNSFKGDGIYAFPHSHDAVDAISVWDNSTRVAFLQTTLTSRRPVTEDSGLLAMIRNVLRATGRSIEDVTFSFIFVVGEEEENGETRHAVHEEEKSLSFRWEQGQMVEVALYYATVEDPLILDTLNIPQQG